MKPLRRLVCVAVLLGVLALVGSYLVAVGLCCPDQQAIAAPSSSPPLRETRFPSASGAMLHGWFIDGQSGRGAILLLHGVHANRLAMFDRARFLSTADYTVLLIDFQAHGESIGQRITFGYLESRDARAALDHLRQAAPNERIGVIGVSMGGAAAVLAEPSLAADAFVLEQVYPTIEEALDNRLRIYLGQLGVLAAPLLSAEMSWHLGISPSQLRPIQRIGGLHAPLMLIAGENDRHTTLAQSQALFAAANEPKQIWIVADAAHVDLHARFPAEYESRVLAFFASCLRSIDAQREASSMPSTATSTMKSISSGVMQYGGMK